MVRQLSVQEFHTWWERADGVALVIDVREPWEVQICTLTGSTHIPMREIPARLHELPADREIAVLCHHGVRGQLVAEFLARNGYANVYNVQGGIDAWAREIDPTMPKY
jgi:rhodanese-related sulfurtransferase